MERANEPLAGCGLLKNIVLGPFILGTLKAHTTEMYSLYMIGSA